MAIQDKFLPIFKDHIMLGDKMLGASRSLRGRVMMIVFYVSDAESRWSEAEMERCNQTWLSMAAMLEKEAEKSNVPLNLGVAVAPLTVSATCTVHNTKEWIAEALSCYGVRTAGDYQVQYEIQNGQDEAPVMFAFNKSFRCYAQSAGRGWAKADEFSVLTSDSTERTMIHELLHQFGAKDLYYPEDVYEAATAYLPNSIMGTCSGTELDSLTRCLIGWSDRLDENAALFLTLTQHHNERTLCEANIREWQRKYEAP